MHNNKRPLYKSLYFWQILIAGLVVLGLIVGIVVMLILSPGEQDRKETQPYVNETTAGPTEPTLPPPPPNPYNPLDFYYEKGYLTCGAGESAVGIDVSFWQGNIDWQQVKDSGVEFVMIRAGFRGSNQGVLEEDSRAQANYEGAKAAGLKIGAYIFSQAISPQEAVEEAEYLLEIVKDWEIDMPLVFDWELVDAESRNAKVDSRTLTDAAIAFCRRIVQAGFEPMIYFSQGHGQDRINLRELVGYKFWLAMYDPIMDYPYQVDMWQYTDRGEVPGISGNVDINLYLTYPEES